MRSTVPARRLYRSTLKNLALLKRFRDREGHARVPRDHVESGYRLGRWVANVRAGYRKGTLNPALISAIERMCPDWEWQLNAGDSSSAAITAIRVLEDYACSGSLLHEAGPNDWHFGHNIRACLKQIREQLEAGTLSVDERQRVFAIPSFISTLGEHIADFHLFVDFLDFFVEDFGHTRIPINYTVEGYEVGAWVEALRVSYRKNQLPDEIIQRLSALPHWTWNLPNAEAYAPPTATPEERGCHIYTKNGTAYRVDPKHYQRLSQYRWSTTRQGYAHRRGRDGYALLQRDVLHLTQKNLRVRFKNENPRDCREENLEVSHIRQRTGPRRTAPWKGSSRYRGVSWSKKHEMWQVVIRHPTTVKTNRRGQLVSEHGQIEWVGCFADETKAAEAYDRRAHEIFGEEAILNFGSRLPRRRPKSAA